MGKAGKVRNLGASGAGPAQQADVKIENEAIITVEGLPKTVVDL